MQNVHGKEIDLLRTTVKVPGKRPPRAVSTVAPTASPKTNGLTKDRSGLQLGIGNTGTHQTSQSSGSFFFLMFWLLVNWSLPSSYYLISTVARFILPDRPNGLSVFHDVGDVKYTFQSFLINNNIVTCKFILSFFQILENRKCILSTVIFSITIMNYKKTFPYQCPVNRKCSKSSSWLYTT